MFLLDTDVLSALRRRERNPEIVRWMEGQRTANLYISVVTVGEIERGITQQQRHNPSFARGPGPLAGPGAGLVQRPDSSCRHRNREEVGPVVGNAWARRRGPAHCRNGVGARADCGDPERASF